MRHSNEQSLQEVLKELLHNRAFRDKYLEAKAKDAFHDMAGPVILQYVSNLYLRQHILYVNLTSAPLRQELHHGRERIRQYINERLGEAYLKEVVLF